MHGHLPHASRRDAHGYGTHREYGSFGQNVKFSGQSGLGAEGMARLHPLDDRILRLRRLESRAECATGTVVRVTVVSLRCVGASGAQLAVQQDERASHDEGELSTAHGEIR